MQSDWQNDEAYNYTKKLDRAGWAWEFLRRNPEYKADWVEYLKKRAQLEKAYGKITSWKTKALDSEPKAWCYDPPKNPGESDAVWRMRCITSDLEPVRSSIMVGLAKKWGLRQYYDPEFPACKASRFISSVPVRIWLHVSEVEAPVVPADRGVFAYIEIDLRRDIAKQIEIIKERIENLEQELLKKRVIEKEKENLSTPHLEKFAIYIRILDAFEANPDVDTKEIAKKFFPYLKKIDGADKGIAKVHEKRRLAIRWLKGYRKLLQLSEK